jgi:sec-independent protein translocase protein TatB
MLDVAWPELLVVGAVALIAIGPKDLPKVMFALGRWAGKARVYAQEMRRTFDQITVEAENAESAKKNEPKTPHDSSRNS